eukprot:12280812-Heterocapsa_arctica.AAC.1
MAIDVEVSRKRLKLRAGAEAPLPEHPTCPPRGCRARWPSRSLRKLRRRVLVSASTSGSRRSARGGSGSPGPGRCA